MNESNVPGLTGEQRVRLAFDLIQSAAVMLSAFPYAEAADALRRQETGAWLTDPTAMRRVDPDDLVRKIRLLDAAAAYVLVWEEVRTEALSELAGNDDE